MSDDPYPDPDYDDHDDYRFTEAVEVPAGSSPDDYPRLAELLEQCPPELAALYRYNWKHYPLNRGPLFLFGEEVGLRVLENYDGIELSRYRDSFTPEPHEQALIDALRAVWNEEAERYYDQLTSAEDDLEREHGWS